MQRDLGGAVGSVSGEAHQAEDRGDIDDASASGRLEMRDSGARRVGGADIVDGHETINVLHIHLEQRSDVNRRSSNAA